MIKIENTEVYGWEAAIRGMRNGKNQTVVIAKNPFKKREE